MLISDPTFLNTCMVKAIILLGQTTVLFTFIDKCAYIATQIKKGTSNSILLHRIATYILYIHVLSSCIYIKDS